MCFVVAGCASPRASLYVDVRSDLTPGIELGGVRIEVLVLVERSDPRTIQTIERPVDLGADYAAGVRAAELDDLDPDTYLVVGTALDRYGAPLVSRRTTVELSGARVITLVLTRDCVGVSCPRATDPAGSTLCLRGVCVPPDCRPENPSACPGALCQSDADCTAHVSCAHARCEAGFCFERGDDTRCAADEWCDPSAGCVPLPTCDPALCADTDPCTDDRCEGALCMHTPLSGVGCDDGLFCNGMDTCADGACTVHAGDPCALGCSEADDRCFACANDADCGSPTRDAWSACSYASRCAESGTRSRIVPRPTCSAGTCTIVDSTENGTCTRATEGDSCGGTSYGDWTQCDYADTCDEAAQRSRDVTDHLCSGGQCVDQTSTETEACSRTTENAVCDTGGTYCGSDMQCRVCRSGSCVVNTPHYDWACHPSCGGSQALCGASAVTCCPSGTACPTAGPGPWDDCAVCCASSGCF